jgi:tetratricopeptide (TPR) repeat protein
MRGGRFSLIVIGVCIIAAATVPTLREAARTVITWWKPEIVWPAPERTRHVADRHPQDVFIQLAWAEDAAARSEFEAWLTEEERVADLSFLRQVVSRFPKSEAAHLRLSAYLLRSTGHIARAEERIGLPSERSYLPREHTPADLQALDEAIQHLKAARDLSPENAAPAFLLARALYERHEDEQAEKALRTALSRPGWSFYSRETANAALTFYEESGVPIVFLRGRSSDAEFTALSEAKMRLAALARMLSGLAEESRQAGQHEEAIFYLEAEIYLAHLMLEKSDYALDGLFAKAILAVTSMYFISEAEREEIRNLGISRKEMVERLEDVPAENLRTYLAEHGRSDLAHDFESDLVQAKAARALSRHMTDEMIREFERIFSSPRVVRAALAWGQAAYVLVLLIMAGLISVLLRTWKEKRTPPRWRWWEWSVLVLFALVPGYLFQFYRHLHLFFDIYKTLEIARGTRERGDVWTLEANFNTPVIILISAGALLLLVVPIVGGLLKRRRQQPEERLGKFRACLASFRTLLPPTFAVLLAAALILTIPAQLKMQRWADEQKKIIQQGEVEYWKIGRP